MHRSAPTLLRWAAWAAGLALLVVLLRRVGWHTLGAALTQAGPRILWLAVAYAAGNVVMALPWRALLPRGRRPSIAGTISSRFVAAGLNAILPMLALGEVTRLGWLPRKDWPEGAAAIVIDRLMLLVASAIAVLTGSLALLLVPGAPDWLTFAAAGVALLMVGAAAGAALLARRGHVARWAHSSVRRLQRAVGQRAPDPAGEALTPERVDAALETLLAGPRRVLLAGLGFHLLGRGFVALEFWIACRLLDLPVGVAGALALSAVPLVLSAVAAFVPSQIGVQEGAVGVIAALMGLGPTAGVLIVLLQRGRQVLFLPVTGVLFALRPRRPR